MVVPPGQMIEGVALAPVGAREELTTTVTLRQVVLLQIPSART